MWRGDSQHASLAAAPVDELYVRVDDFVARTRAALFVRPVDGLLMIRPDKTMSINASAATILQALYRRDSPGAAATLTRLAGELEVEPARLRRDTAQLIDAVGALLNEDYAPRAALRFGAFDRGMVAYPTLAEIALTYGCQNRCLFCYAGSPSRDRDRRLMTTAEVKRVMQKIFSEAHVPSLSFTGGESTLRADLPELIGHGKTLGFRVNLISNGLRLADADYARGLVEAGLDSAQISLEAGTEALHDEIVGKPGAYARTVAGVGQLQRLGIHVHTNTTLCARNLDHAEALIRFVGRELKLRTLSMNMVIQTGEALGQPRIGVTYSEVAARLPALIEAAAAEGVKLVWYSPIPYCIFNPVLHGLGAKACACVDGILSVDPAGQVLPCSSFESGIGSLLDQPFERIYRGRAAGYWRKKRFVPPACSGCADVDVCAGACPLYWDAAGSFDELPVAGADDPGRRRRWERQRTRSKSFGVQAPDRAGAPCA